MIGEIFNLALVNPLINFLVLLTNILFGSFGLAIIAFTIIIRTVTFPLTLRQLHQTRAMQSLQPRVQEINKKYSDPKRRQEELMKAYREAGVNPLGCLGPMMIQMPILFALYWAVQRTLALSPEALENLSGRLYGWSFLQHAVPLEETFLGIDLRYPSMILVVLVAVTTWLQTKTTVMVSTDERARAQQQMMLWLMPIMFAFFALSFPSGVALYWVVNSIVGIAFNILTYGLPLLKIEPVFKHRVPAPAAALADGPSPPGPSPSQSARELRTANGPRRSKRQNRRRRS